MIGLNSGSDLGDWRLGNSLTTVNCIVEEVTDVLSGKISLSAMPSAFTHQQTGDTGCSFSCLVGTQHKDFTTITKIPLHPSLFCLNTSPSEVL